MRIKLIALLILLSSCGSGGGGSGTSSANAAFVGSWLMQTSNPADNVYLGMGATGFNLQQRSCQMTGSFSTDANYLHVVINSRTSACVGGRTSFSCTYSMPTNNQLDISCPELSGSFQRQ